MLMPQTIPTLFPYNLAVWILLEDSKMTQLAVETHINAQQSVPDVGCWSLLSAGSPSAQRNLPLGFYRLKEFSLQEIKPSWFILKYVRSQLGTSSGALWVVRESELVSGHPGTIHRFLPVTFVSVLDCILLRQCVLKIKTTSLKSSSWGMFLKGTMIPFCFSLLLAAPLIVSWVKRRDKGTSCLEWNLYWNWSLCLG